MKDSGFPLDDMLDGVDSPEPRDDWEKAEKEREENRAELLAKAIYSGDTSSVEAIKKTICKFNKLANVMRGM